MLAAMRRSVCAGLLGLLLLVGAPARAHDYWLEFSPRAPRQGDLLSLSLWVGEDFAAHEQKAMEIERTLSLRHLSGAGDEDLRPLAREGAAPIVKLPLREPGGHLLALERTPAHISMRALKFNRYLKHEGLRAAFAERKRSGERYQRARERYTRYLKAFVQVGAAADGVSTRVLGHRIELVPERDVAAARVGERLALQVRFEGEPLAGVMVEAFVRDAAGEPLGQQQTSDAKGWVEFTLGQRGAWLVRTVHMQRCIGCDDAEWESFWTAYSFAVGQEPGQ
jgi:uncharacterized GH25 family protein